MPGPLQISLQPFFALRIFSYYPPSDRIPPSQISHIWRIQMLQKGQEVEVIYHRDGDVTIHNSADEKQLEKLEIVTPNKFAHPVHNLGVDCMVRQLLKHVAFRNVTAVLVNAVFVTQ